MIDGHGDDIYRYGNKVKANFSTNIHQNVDHSGLMRHLSSCSRLLSNYPEPEPVSVERVLGKKYGIPVENIIVTNGATEAVYLIAEAARDAHSIIVIPTFHEYQDACRRYNHRIEFMTETEFINGKLTASSPRLVWLCNPNNPTGKVFDRTFLLHQIESMPDTVFIIDQAYANYSVCEVLNVNDILMRDNVIMLQSLTKQFAIPGLRIGYAIGSSKLILPLKNRRMPWAVNSFAIEAFHYLTEHESEYKINRDLLHKEATRIANAFQMTGIQCSPTDCNFILCKLPDDHTADQLKEWLVNRYGLLIRDASNFESLDSRYFRIAAQSREENDLLIKSINEWMSS